MTTSPPPQPTPEEARTTQSLAQDRPTMDGAVKSFISLVCARVLADAATSDAAASAFSSMAITTTTGTAAAAAGPKKNPPMIMGIINPGESSSSTTTTILSSTMNHHHHPNNTNIMTPQQQVLQLARAILNIINAYTFPIHCTVASSLAEKPGTSDEKKRELLELSVVATLWNGLVQSQQKPSRFLGRRSLKLAWKTGQMGLAVKSKILLLLWRGSLSSLVKEEPAKPAAAAAHPANTTSASHTTTTTTTTACIRLDEEEGDEDPAVRRIQERQLEWLQEFERLLFQDDDTLQQNVNEDNDAALLWDIDGGEKELAKRRQRRQNAATKRGPVTPS